MITAEGTTIFIYQSKGAEYFLLKLVNYTNIAHI